MIFLSRDIVIDLVSHFACKCAAILFKSICMVAHTITFVLLSTGWLISNVTIRYLFYYIAANCFCSRTVTGINPFNSEFLSDWLQIFPKWEDSALTQIYCSPVSHNTVRGFYYFGLLANILKITGFISQMSIIVTAGVFGSWKLSSNWMSLISCRPLDAKKSVGVPSGGFILVF